MDLSLFTANLTSPPVLFFFLGMIAAWWKVDIEFPEPVPRMLSMYLLFSIGFRGGVELGHSGIEWNVATTLLVGMLMAALSPLYMFWWVKRKFSAADSSALAAAYGSISAVTFLSAIAFLNAEKIPFGGHLIAAMALMEAPAILAGLALYRRYGAHQKDLPLSEVLKDSFLNGSIFLLIGSLVIGYLAGPRGESDLQVFYEGIFRGVLCFFLLELGIVTMRELRHAREAGFFLLSFAVLAPMLNGFIGIVLARLLGLAPGDALLFAVLCGSASYIAVPAAFRLAVPEANPAIYLGAALGVTFPMSLAISIPLYHVIIQKTW